jgi:large subunit ribosomal protein L9
MMVILRENVTNLGRIGDVVRVPDGYARNYLIPRKLVLEADENNVAQVEHHKKSLEKRRLQMKEASQELANKMKDVSVTLTRKTGEGDRLFGSVTAGDIVEALAKAGHHVEKSSIQLNGSIKSLGVHPVTVKFSSEVTTTIKVWVAKEE